MYCIALHCIAALKDSTINDWSDTDENYFIAHSWYFHGECMHPTWCLENDERWEREAGVCIPGLITGSSADYLECETNSTTNVEVEGSIGTCKYPTDKLRHYHDHDNITNCWNNTDSNVEIDPNDANDVILQRHK